MQLVRVTQRPLNWVMLCFVTVGTTRFDDLLSIVTSSDFIQALQHKGYKRLVIQAGSSEFDDVSLNQRNISIEWYKYKPNIEDDIDRADLVISHAGAGSCLEIMYAKKPCIVVINDKLMGNHQTELAEKLASLGHIQHTVPKELVKTLEIFDASELTHYEKGDPTIISRHLHGLLGLASS